MRTVFIGTKKKERITFFVHNGDGLFFFLTDPHRASHPVSDTARHIVGHERETIPFFCSLALASRPRKKREGPTRAPCFYKIAGARRLGGV